MPWTAKDAESHTAKANTPKKRATWAKVANSRLAQCLKAVEGTPSDAQRSKCESSAVKVANAMVGNINEADVVVEKIMRDEDGKFTGPGGGAAGGAGKAKASKQPEAVALAKALRKKAKKPPSKYRPGKAAGEKKGAGGGKGKAKKKGTEKKGGGGGGGGAAKPTRDDVLKDLGIDSDTADALLSLFGGKEISEKLLGVLVEKKFVTQADDGAIEFTKAGKKAIKSLQALKDDKASEMNFTVPSDVHIICDGNRAISLGYYGLAELVAYFDTHDHEDPNWQAAGGTAGRKWARRVWSKYEGEIMAQLGEQTSETDTATEKGTEVEEMANYAVDFVPMGPTTFAQLQAAQEAQETADKVRTLAYQYHDLILNAIRQPDGGMVGAIKSLGTEFLALLTEAVGGETEDDEVTEGGVGAVIELSESATGHALTIAESDNGASRRAPLDLDILIIQPGFGNKKDMHYYGGQMLTENAPVFVGAKMYSTDHREDEKSVRTEVSRIKEIVGFDNGAPIGRVKVFDPDFAELVRNRADAGELQSLECSILANGTARKGEIKGQEAKIVESITDVRSVDWVTKAGAGGHALRLSESEVDMKDEQNKPEQELEETELEEVTIEEGETQVEPEAPQDAPDEPQGDGEPQGEPEPEPEPQPLSAEEVGAFIPDALPEQTRKRLLEQTYLSESEAKAAIVLEVDYVRVLTGSGKPFSPKSVESAPASFEEAAEKQKAVQAAINERWLG